jgi:nucleotide-binding universal stress UspA family protein
VVAEFLVVTGIVVGVDGSNGAANALRWAVREADLHDIPVTAVLAWSYLDQHRAAATSFDPGYTEDDARAALDASVHAALDGAPAATVDRLVVCDRAAPALLAASSRADLLVVGARGLGGFRGLVLGSVSQQCLHHTARPICVVHGTHQLDGPLAGRIVVGVDGSSTAQQALQWAVDEARLRTAEIDIVHAWRAPIPFAGVAPLAATSMDPAAMERAARENLDINARSVNMVGLARRVNRILVSGGAAAMILETAKGADLVVVGSRGLGGFTSLLLGSVGQQVATHAGCPVVVIRPREK